MEDELDNAIVGVAKVGIVLAFILFGIFMLIQFHIGELYRRVDRIEQAVTSRPAEPPE